MTWVSSVYFNLSAHNPAQFVQLAQLSELTLAELPPRTSRCALEFVNSSSNRRVTSSDGRLRRLWSNSPLRSSHSSRELPSAALEFVMEFVIRLLPYGIVA